MHLNKLFSPQPKFSFYKTEKLNGKGSFQKKSSVYNEFFTKGGGVSDQNHYFKVFNNSEKTLGRGGTKTNISFFISPHIDCQIPPAPSSIQNYFSFKCFPNIRLT